MSDTALISLEYNISPAVQNMRYNLIHELNDLH